MKFNKLLKQYSNYEIDIDQFSKILLILLDDNEKVN